MSKMICFSFVADLKKILNLLNDDGDDIEKSTVIEVMDKLQPLITAANIGKFGFISRKCFQ